MLGLKFFNDGQCEEEAAQDLDDRLSEHHFKYMNYVYRKAMLQARKDCNGCTCPHCNYIWYREFPFPKDQGCICYESKLALLKDRAYTKNKKPAMASLSGMPIAICSFEN